MIVISLTNCPPSLRGDLTKWLQEISTGVYAGQVSAGVREALWQRVCKNAKDGRAVMVYGTNNEQRIGFKVYQGEWEPIDFDGLKLMMHPSKPKLLGRTQDKPSKASIMHTASKMTSAIQNKSKYPRDYCVLDIETTGLDKNRDEIIELAAIRTKNGEQVDSYSTLVKPHNPLPQSITELTGITNEMVQKDGVTIAQALKMLINFIGDDTIICHNAAFDQGFLNIASQRTEQKHLDNKCHDTCIMARRHIEELNSYKLEMVAKHFDIRPSCYHRSLEDCRTTHRIYEKMIEMLLQKE